MERQAVLDIAITVAKIYDGIDFSMLSEKEDKMLTLFVDKGLGRVHNVSDVDGTTLMKYYKFNP
jgi:hypothetical protein